jgi:hypothetical protein
VHCLIYYKLDAVGNYRIKMIVLPLKRSGPPPAVGRPHPRVRHPAGEGPKHTQTVAAAERPIKAKIT